MSSILKSCGWILLEFLTTIVSIGIIVLILIASGATDDEFIKKHAMDITYSIVAVSDIIIVLIAIQSCKRKNLNPVSEWKLSKLSLKEYFFPCSVAFTYSAFFFLISHKPSQYSLSPIIVLSLLIVSPVSNEIINRGIILNTLKKRFSVNKAIIISSILFVFLARPSNILSVVNTVIICIIMAIIYEKSGSLLAAVTANTAATLPELFRFIIPEISNIIKITVAPIMLLTSAALLIIWIKPQKT